MLDSLPIELLLEIISLLSCGDNLALGATCKNIQAAVRLVPSTWHRHWVGQYLHLVERSERISRGHQGDSEGEDWNW
jgi:hypothetical protein